MRNWVFANLELSLKAFSGRIGEGHWETFIRVDTKSKGLLAIRMMSSAKARIFNFSVRQSKDLISGSTARLNSIPLIGSPCQMPREILLGVEELRLAEMEVVASPIIAETMSRNFWPAPVRVIMDLISSWGTFPKALEMLMEAKQMLPFWLWVSLIFFWSTKLFSKVKAFLGRT